ncbi:hypothetical protein [Nocardioides litoris]|uniref:hypothetical protein n=1 Tax=Nocardioides litoris TaxID=1926648 RepID=UPI00111F59C3|nr:hypothetical protein [Nocardioides litoris]
MLLVVGALVGLATVLLHDRASGLVLGAVASFAATWALPGGWTLRCAFTTGWALALAWCLLPRGSGGFLVASDTDGYLLLGLGLVLLVAGIVTVRPLRPPPTDEP